MESLIAVDNLLKPAFAVAVFVLAALMIIYVHRTLSRILDKRLARVDKIKRMDPLHTDLLSKKAKRKQKEAIAERIDARFSVIRRFLVGAIIVVAIGVAVMPFLSGLSSTFVSLLFTGVTVIVGIAARPFVENIFSGIVISLSNQIRVGDTLLIDGQYGTVEDVLVTHTRIKTWDWRRYLIPNTRMLTKEFVNLTLREKQLWSYLEFYVSYEADLETVERLAYEAAKSSEHCSDVDEPQFWVIRMEPESILCWIAAWANTPSEAWALKSDMAQYMIKAMKREGIATNIKNVDVTGRQSGGWDGCLSGAVQGVGGSPVPSDSPGPSAKYQTSPAMPGSPLSSK